LIQANSETLFSSPEEGFFMASMMVAPDQAHG